jgi:hypothetical protein
MRRYLFLFLLAPTLALAGSVDVRQETVDGQAVATVNDNFRRLDQQKLDKRAVEKLIDAAVTDFSGDSITVSSITVTNTITGGWLAAAYPMMIVEDQKASGTNAGTFTSGAWLTRTLNTVTTNTIVGASLSASTITLPSGTYYVEFHAPAYAVNSHKAIFRDVTNTVDTIIGESAHCYTGDVWSTSSGGGVFSISSNTNFIVAHRCSVTSATYGLGTGQAAFGVTEVYTRVIIWKLR